MALRSAGRPDSRCQAMPPSVSRGKLALAGLKSVDDVVPAGAGCDGPPGVRP
jgi:hypothetical protein